MWAVEISGNLLLDGIPSSLVYCATLFFALTLTKRRLEVSSLVLTLLGVAASLSARLLTSAIEGGIAVPRNMLDRSAPGDLLVAFVVHAAAVLLAIVLCSRRGPD
jgi:hypothetical protein